jgi:hypothetical protein
VWLVLMRIASTTAGRRECSARNTSTPAAGLIRCWRCPDANMSRVIVIGDFVWDGTIGRGGHTMCMLEWLRGLERLGHEVLFLDLVRSDFQEHRERVSHAFGEVIQKWWHANLTSLMVASTFDSLYGLDAGAVSRFAEESAVLIAVGVPASREPFPLTVNVRPRILIDHDPVYTQSWVTTGDPLDIFGDQDLYFTVGGNIGSPRCSVPTFGISWRPIWNPIVLDWWWPQQETTNDRFTTVADWYSQGYIAFGDRVLGPKVEEFRKFLELPRLIGKEIEVVLTINPDDPDIDKLTSLGWRIRHPDTVRTPEMYCDYIRSSRGEFSCAKGGYAATRCGWFSDRSQAYLAAGRPTILQATGFEDLLPTGKGLFAFTTVDEVVGAINAVIADYALHSAAARQIALEHFDSDKILRRLLADAGVA